MKCPDCGTAISQTKHYDPTYEWFECPKCEGCFTYDEILEGGTNESDESENADDDGNSSRQPRKKAPGGRGAQRTNAGRKNGRVQKADEIIRREVKRAGVVAKGKKRRTEILEDEEVIKEHEKKILESKVKVDTAVKHRDEIDSTDVVNIWTDEILDVYHDLGRELDEVNAREKARFLWHQMHYSKGVTAREQSVDHVLCKEHQ